MAGQWYVMGRDDVHGPYSKEQLLRLIDAGKVKPHMPVRQGNVGPFRPAAKVPGLLAADQHAKPAGLSSGVKLGLIVGGAVVGTSVLTAITCIAVLGLGRRDAAEESAPVAAVALHPDPVDASRPDVAAEADPEAPFEPAPTPLVVEPTPPPEPERPVDHEQADGEVQDAEVEAAVAEVLIDPRPLIPAIPAQKVPVGDKEIKDFGNSVRLEQKATDAYARYLAFSQTFAFSDEQRPQVESELAEWKERADKDLRRLGTEWASLEELQSAEKVARTLIDRAFVLIKMGSYAQCVEFLEDASRVNPNGIEADYTLGLLNSLPIGFKAPEVAEKHFKRVLLRSPDHPAALNSVAISQLKQGDFSAAFTSFERSSALTPKCTEVAHNLGRAVMLAQCGRLPIQPGTLRRFTDLYSTLITDERASAFNERIGWLHMLPVLPAVERNQKPPEQQRDPQMIASSEGSGFVVAP